MAYDPALELAPIQPWTRWAAATHFGWQAPPMPAGDVPVASLRICGLTGFVGQALTFAGDDRARSLEMEVQRIRIRNAFARSELESCLAELSAQGVAALPIKGAAFLLARDDAALSVRPMSDIDLVVLDSSYSTVRRVLIDKGYRATRAQRTPFADLLYCSQAFHRKLGPQLINIDLHRRFKAWPVLRKLSRRIDERIANTLECRGPDPELSLSIAVAHRAGNRRYSDLRELIDITSIWTAMGAARLERSLGALEGLGLTVAAQACWCEINHWFAPPATVCAPLRSRLAGFGVGELIEFDPEDCGWLQVLRRRYGFGRPHELIVAAGIHYVVAGLDRLLFARGSNRWQRTKPSAPRTEKSALHYWRRPIASGRDARAK